MSAFMVGPEHIHVLIWAAVHARATDYDLMTYTTDEPTPFNAVEPSGLQGLNIRRLRRGTESAYGQFLVDANAASVNRRYSEDNAYVYEWRRPRHTRWSVVELLGALNCYEYQVCEEVEDWRSSEAKSFCDTLRRVLEQRLKGAGEAPWEISTMLVGKIIRCRPTTTVTFYLGLSPSITVCARVRATLCTSPANGPTLNITAAIAPKAVSCMRVNATLAPGSLDLIVVNHFVLMPNTQGKLVQSHQNPLAKDPAK